MTSSRRPLRPRPMRSSLCPDPKKSPASISVTPASTAALNRRDALFLVRRAVRARHAHASKSNRKHRKCAAERTARKAGFNRHHCRPVSIFAYREASTGRAQAASRPSAILTNEIRNRGRLRRRSASMRRSTSSAVVAVVPHRFTVGPRISVYRRPPASGRIACRRTGPPYAHIHSHTIAIVLPSVGSGRRREGMRVRIIVASRLRQRPVGRSKNFQDDSTHCRRSSFSDCRPWVRRRSSYVARWNCISAEPVGRNTPQRRKHPLDV